MFENFMSGAGASMFSGAASLIGGMMANSQNAAMAREQMAFQERMRDTAYQAAVKDLQKAGLNPMLAYSQGGAATPSGSSYTSENVVGPAVSNALQAYQGFQAVENMKTLQAKMDAETNKIAADTAYVNQETIRSAADTALAPYRQGLMAAQTSGAAQHKTYEGALTDQLNITNRLVGDKWRSEIANLDSMSKRNLSTVNALGVNTALDASRLAEAHNNEAKAGTWWGRNVSPYLNDFGSSVNSASKLYNMLP